MRVLLIEDNEQLSLLMIERLSTRGILVDSTNSIKEANSYFNASKYDAIVLDLGLPDGDGITWLKSLPLDRPPILILSARSSLDDRLVGLDTGADDYLVKPAQIDEIAARLRALQRRPGARSPTVLSNGKITLNPQTREVHIDHELVQLGKKEFLFLEVLMRRVGSVVARESLESVIYSMEPVTPNALEAIASRLRRRLSAGGLDNVLHTVRGVGYYLGVQG
jgi:two-component system response regulator QseB